MFVNNIYLSKWLSQQQYRLQGLQMFLQLESMHFFQCCIFTTSVPDLFASAISLS